MSSFTILVAMYPPQCLLRGHTASPCVPPDLFMRRNNEMLSLTACGTSCQPLLGDEATSRCRLTLPYAVSATRNTLYRKRLGDTRGMLRCKALVYRHHLRLHAISFDRDCGSGMHYWLNTIVGFVPRSRYGSRIILESDVRRSSYHRGNNLPLLHRCER